MFLQKSRIYFVHLNILYANKSLFHSFKQVFDE